MHTFAKVALVAAIGMASAQASALSIISTTDTDVSPLNINQSGTYKFTGDSIPGTFGVNFARDVIESTWSFSWDPRLGLDSEAVQFTLEQNGSAVATAEFTGNGTSMFTTAGLSAGNYIMSMTVVGGQYDEYGFSGAAALSTLGDDVNPVPLPAAAWLFISGIAGYAGVSMKKKKKAA
ncbi:VPLPA-CTERM sorting domain-containing protein [Allohahella sp. A8]|uniref:VPLPA-CTERM sorting domain-containing protein n=1 Tax=Allohahella sp. A8 TaxID=3141461 RepID=UPI000C0959BA|nr:hypothetical protein [Hahellaceae bacterium]|tara:strand:- start:7283 stop:7816 length:534 start_codon:yes stop_codon:yes gene_type:complete